MATAAAPAPAAAPAAATFSSASLYVGDLMNDVTEAMLYEVFNSVGPVASIRVCRDSVTRRSLGYAYVNYHSASDAERALDTLNYSNVKGHPCRIMWSHRDPAMRRSAVGNIFVKNLDKSIDNKALYDTFSLFGNILSCKVAIDDKGQSRGYGFVHYETEEAAKTSIERVNGMQIGSKTVFVGPFIKKTERVSGKDEHFTNIYVKDFPASWTEEVLQSVFAKYGQVTSVAVMTDKKERPFGFVNFEKSEDAHKAVSELNGKACDDNGVLDTEPEAKEGEEVKHLYAGRAQSKTERQSMLRQQFDSAQAGLANSATEKKDPRFNGVNLYIKNLDDKADDAKLREAFEPFGTVTSAKVMRDDKGVSRGFGFVSFVSPDEATKAVTEMHLKLMNGKPLYVGLAEKREQRLQRLQQRYRMPQGPRGGPMAGPMGGMAPFGQPFGMPMGPSGMFFSPGMGGPRGPAMAGGPQMFPGQMMMPQRPGMMGPGMFPARPGMQQGGMQQMPMGGMMGMGPMAAMRPGGPGMFNPMAMAGMNAAMMGMQQQRPMSGMGGRPGQGPRPQQFGQAKAAPQAKAANYRFTAQARNQQMPGQATEMPQPAAPAPEALTAAQLAAAPPAMQKQLLGERLFPLIARQQPELAGKITGMMLEMDNGELLVLLDSETALKAKVDEAMRVLDAASAQA